MKDSNSHGRRLLQKRAFHQTNLNSFIVCKASKQKMSTKAAGDEQIEIPRNKLAEMIANELTEGDPTSTTKSNNAIDTHNSTTTPVTYLTNDGESWYIHLKRWYPPPKESYQESFDYEWNLHPLERRQLKLYGKTFLERRWSQCWGQTISYSGLINQGRSIDESTVVQYLFDKFNSVIEKTPLKAGCYRRIDGDVKGSGEHGEEFIPPYNACLQNWYESDDTIGLHADDESHNRPEFPIFSLSWGGTRRFLFRCKEKRNEKVEIYLENGDLLVMGGSCQKTHKHEIPKRRVTIDPPTSKRINWTIRAVTQNINEQKYNDKL